MKTLLIIVALMTILGILTDFKLSKNPDIVVSKEILANRDAPLASERLIIPTHILELPKKILSAKSKGNDDYKAEVFRAYCVLSSANKNLASGIMLEIMDILIRENDAQMLFEFFKISPYSDDLILKVYQCAGSPKIMEYLTYEKGKEAFFGGYKAIGYAIMRSNCDIGNASYDKLEKTFKYACEYYFNGTISDNAPREFGIYILLAYVAHIKNDINLYEYYKSKAIEQSRIDGFKRAFFEYTQMAAKIFAICKDVQLSIDFLERLPRGEMKNLVVKRCLRYILETEDGINAIEKSKLLEN